METPTRLAPIFAGTIPLTLFFCVALVPVRSKAAESPNTIDVSQCAIVTAPNASTPIQKAAQMLADEVAHRTLLRWSRGQEPIKGQPNVFVGTFADLQSVSNTWNLNLNWPSNVEPTNYEGYGIWTTGDNKAPQIIVSGKTPRSVLFGVGRLLRELRMERKHVELAANLKLTSTPRMPLRGHQLGFRPKTNSYDAWDVPTWEQYIRDLIVFGCNAIELIPPRSDDDDDSPHFPRPQMEMMIEMSRLAADYDLDVWVWYPAMDKDYSQPATVDFALREWAGVFRQLPRVDAVFVPGGDPGHTQPKHLLALLERQTTNLHQFHPHAAMWVSPQSFNKAWMDEFLTLMRAEPAWLSGVAYGPQVRMPLADLRAALPARYPIRDYPDITHSRHCQYPVPDWDFAWAVTEGREVINPRPTQMAQIFRATTRSNAIGFITYSEGCNDDLNKAVWSALGWDPDAKVGTVVRDYARYFIGGPRASEFADGLLDLEQNWNGAVVTNTSIASTWERFRALEKAATPHEKRNWRFQQALYRAYYDEYVRRRATIELALETAAVGALDGTGDSLTRIKVAEDILQRSRPESVAPDLRARLFELGEALFQSIGMQLSSTRYAGESGRGTTLDDLDAPLNDAAWLRHRFDQIKRLPDETARRGALHQLVHRTDPGPGGFYDDFGDPQRQPHLVRSTSWELDPGFFRIPQIGFNNRVVDGTPVPRAWATAAESLYDATLQAQYTGLDPAAHYRLRVVYGKYRNSGRIRLVAGTDGKHEIHGWLKKENQTLEFDVPPAATASGSLLLTWQPDADKGGNGRVMEVAEVWLLRPPSPANKKSGPEK